jgi:hypothetical protein
MISVPTGSNKELSTIHRATTTTQVRNKRNMEKKAREGQ